ncbi:DNA-processing protein DprA [Thermovibrio sp.]
MERLLTLALFFKKGFGYSSYRKIISDFGSLTKAYSEGFLKVEDGLVERAQKEIERASSLGFKVITVSDDDYPDSFLSAPQPPLAFYAWGELPKGPFASVVGSRRCSDYGRRTAFKLGKFLSEAGVFVVSGLAFGIDSFAHRGAVSGGGRTVAVLGSSLDRVYPEVNRFLAKEIVDSGGCVISEFPLGTRARREFFPRRNRLVAALGEVLIVVEATQKSGTSITVNYALEMGKEVLAVPGNIDSPFSVGTNKLIYDGAVPLFDFKELLNYFSLKEAPAERSPDKFAEVYQLLKASPLSADQIAYRLGREISFVIGALSYLEVMGFVRREGVSWQAV